MRRVRGLLWLLLLGACTEQENARDLAPPDDLAAASDFADTDARGPVDAANEDAATSECPSGGTLLRTLACAAGVAPSSTLSAAAQAATRGDIVSLDGLDEAALPCLPARICRPTSAPTLVFSDEPESPSTDGVLYADTLVAGAYRVYLYHVNGAASGSRKFPAVVLNQGTADVHISFGARGEAGPATDYVATGQAAAAAWLASAGGGTLTVPAGTRVLLDTALDARHAATGELVVAQLDFTSDGPLKLSVVSVDAGTDAASATAGLSLLPNDGQHVRGTFAGADLQILPIAPTGWPNDGMHRFRMGAGSADGEPILSGVDAVDGNTSVSLSGNYGVRYRLALDGGPFALGCSPRGGAWAGAAQVPPGLDSSTAAVALPSSAVSIADTNSMALLGRFAAGSDSELELLSAGGSNLPVDLIYLPAD